VVVIVGALVYEVTDETNGGIGMAFTTGGYSIGLVVGPVLGGVLAFPGDLYPETFPPDSIFSKFGVLLPNLVITLGYVLAIVFAIIYIPNDCKRTPRVTYIKLEDEKNLIQSSIKKENTPPTNSRYAKKENEFKDSDLGKIIFDKGCFRTCILYALYAFVGVGFDELFPLYAATSRDYDGFGFTTSEIGTSLMIAAVVVLISQFTVMARSFMYCCLVTTFVLPIIPLSYHYRIVNKIMFWFVMLTALIILRFLISFAFLIINIMINNAADPKLLGLVNGFALTISTIARAITVPMVGNIFGWSLTNVKHIPGNKDALGFPFNQYFSFFVLASFSVFSTLFVFILPKSIDKKFILSR